MSIESMKDKEISALKYFVLDVDGTMTDSGLYFDDNGNEWKRFSSRDFVGVMAAHYVGIKVLIVTGRECAATKRRANEMHVDYLFQNVKNKKEFIRAFMEDNNIKEENLGYIGDDLNDYAAMQLSGFIACPKDACVEIQNKADYISGVNGGQGVVQDVFRWLLGSLGKWDDFIRDEVEKGY